MTYLMLKTPDAQLVIEKGWGVKHPWSDRLASDGLTLLMIYAPRNDADLAEVKKVLKAAWQLALE